jgi:hypothetical protein
MFALASARTQRFLLRLVGRLLLKQGNTHTPSSSWLFSHEQKNEFSVARPFLFATKSSAAWNIRNTVKNCPDCL